MCEACAKEYAQITEKQRYPAYLELRQNMAAFMAENKEALIEFNFLAADPSPELEQSVKNDPEAATAFGLTLLAGNMLLDHVKVYEDFVEQEPEAYDIATSALFNGLTLTHKERSHTKWGVQQA